MTALAHNAEPSAASSAPPFECGGVVFRCYAEDGGQRYVWRDDAGRFEVSAAGVQFPTDAQRENGARAERMWRAVSNGREVGTAFTSIKFAMDAAVWAHRRGA